MQRTAENGSFFRFIDFFRSNFKNGASSRVIAFVPARNAPGKAPLLIVGNEISGTTAGFRIELH